MDDAAIRAAALLAAAIAQSGLNPPAGPAALTAYAAPLISWIGYTPAVLTLTIEGDPPMPLNIDSVNAKAVLSFADRLGERVAPPAGTLAVASSSDQAILAVGPAQPGTDAAGVPTIEFPLTEAGAGTATLSVHATDAAGGPLIGPDGVTPIPDPDPVTVAVAPGAPAAEVFTVVGS